MPGTHGHPTNPKILLKWINIMLRSDYRSMSELNNGAAWCRLFYCIYPDSFNVEAVVDVGPPAVLQRNYDILMRTLNRLGIPRQFCVQKLMKGNTTDTIELVHFFMDLYVHKKLAQNRQRPQPQLQRGPLKEFLGWLKRLIVGTSMEDDPEAYLLLFEEMNDPKPQRRSQPTQTLSPEMNHRLSGGQKKEPAQQPQQQQQQQPEDLQGHSDQRRKDHDEIRPLIDACHQMLQFQNDMEERWLEYRRARLARQKTNQRLH
ncbi:uncharacterized protein [Drosophila pseudoobscura]|uniref:Calponin-homology (CH) domain-containing protein n=1 Tax=Drosophila pseudoobscura pseudoobscura TaxID=46245 RepID=A0A6I8UYT5_DROPS|nr:uncharacterized protein LOC6902099 [Drosophila pseudoobscura]